MKRSIELRQKRSKVFGDARAISAKAEGEDRDLTPEERAKFDALMGEYQSLGDQVERLEMLEAEERSMEGLLDQQADANMGGSRTEGSDSRPMMFRDVGTGREFRCYRHNEPLTDMRSGDGLDFARAIVERFTGQRLLTPERRAIQVDADVQGGFVGSATAGLEVFQFARAKMAATRARATVMPITGQDDVTIATVTADPTFTWTRELEEFERDEATAFGAIKLSARKIITQMEVSNEAMRSPMIARLLMDLITTSLAAEIDRVALSGSGSGAEPTGVMNTSGILTAAATGGIITIDQMIDLVGTLQAANVDPTDMILSPAVNTLISKFKDGEGNYMSLPGDLGKIQRIVSSKMAAQTLIMGDFENLLLCPFGRIEIETAKDLGARKGSYVIEVIYYFDCAPVWPGRFITLTGIAN